MNLTQALTHPIASIKKAAQMLSLRDPKGWNSLLSTGTTYTGKPVNDDVIFQITAVWSAIRLIGETVGTLPVQVYQKTDRGRVVARDHRLYAKIRRRPSKYVTAPSFYESIAVSLAVNNQAYILVERIGSRVGSMSVLPKSCVKPVIDDNGIDLEYRVTLNGKENTYQIGEIIPIKGFGLVGQLEGSDVAGLHKNAFALSMAAEEYGARFFGNGARPSGFLMLDRVLKEDQRDALRKSFEGLHEGVENSHKLAILEANMKYQAVSSPNDSAQLLETRKMQIAEIARIFRVPPHMLMEEVGLKYDGYEQATMSYLTYSLRPYLERIEAAMNAFLLTDEDINNGFYVEFNVEGLLRGDSKSRAEYYQKLFQVGGISPNEIREKENHPRSDDPGADDLYVPSNMMPTRLVDSFFNASVGTDEGKSDDDAE